MASSLSAADFEPSCEECVSGTGPTTGSITDLSFGANYKAAYSLLVCPAGEEVIAPFLTDRKGFLEDVVKPLQDKVETIYVVRGSDFEEYVARRFPNKNAKRVANGLAGQGSIRDFQLEVSMGIHDLPKKWRERARGDAGLLACADVRTFSDSDVSLWPMWM